MVTSYHIAVCVLPESSWSQYHLMFTDRGFFACQNSSNCGDLVEFTPSISSSDGVRVSTCGPLCLKSIGVGRRFFYN
ncbi:unnamed protein product [Schistocephalus solidus]|uniref:Secreted protein n=1 Tax=Schistocephalus solidus TaxID=70667 RepID=A0A183TFL6_SCHSO|nr:unnamed protein product [Schistocephalus solidus]